MTDAIWQECEQCHAIFDERSAVMACNHCGGLLTIEQLPPSNAAGLRERFDTAPRESSGVWRFAELMVPSIGVDERVSHPEGNTPLIARALLSQWSGVPDLRLKHEGHNPTGSFKDRGMTVGVSQAKRLGVTAVACASTGNTSASLAAYAAQAGIPALVFIPKGQVALGKLTQSLAYGARTLVVDTDFDGCLSLAQRAASELGIYLLNSVNPFRLEGQKTIVFELLQQLGWEVPDWLVLPAGNLGNTGAFGKALREAKQWGLIGRVPRLVAVQAAGASPFAHAFEHNFEQLIPARAETIATAIRIGAPASFARAARAIRETDGRVLRVTDREILEAKAAIDRAGVGCEPASAATLAGIRQLQQRGLIQPGERVVGILTGHLLKDPGLLQQMHERISPDRPWANPPVPVAATLEAIAHEVRSLQTAK